MMKFWEAMKALEEGKKVYCPSLICSVKWYIEDFAGTKYIVNENDRGVIDFCVYLYQCLGREWEIYEKPEQLLTFSEVIKGLKKGKKFKRKSWQKCSLLSGAPSINLSGFTRLQNQFGDLTTLYIEDFEATDWIEVK